MFSGILRRMFPRREPPILRDDLVDITIRVRIHELDHYGVYFTPLDGGYIRCIQLPLVRRMKRVRSERRSR